MHDFQQLYDAAPAPKLDDLGLEELYGVLNIPLTLKMGRSDINEKIKNRIITLLQVDSENEPHIPSYELYGCMELWFYKDAIFNKSYYTPYYNALDQLRYMFGNEISRFIPFAEKDLWTEALTLLKGYMSLNKRDNGSFTRGKDKEKERVRAVKRLMKLGAKVNFDNNELNLTHIDPILRRISDNMESIGGVQCIEYILSKLAYNEQFCRFIMPYFGSAMGMKKATPALPFTYIFNLAFNKVLRPGRKEVDKCIGETIRLATDICTALYNVQSYNIWEDVFAVSKEFEKSFERWVLWDSLYNIAQASPLFVQKWMDFLLTEFAHRGVTLVSPYTLDDYKKMMEYMMPRMKPKTFTRLSKSTIFNECEVEYKSASAILKDIVCSAPNPGYLHPNDYEKVTAPDYPAFELPNGDVMLYPAPMGVMGWYEVLMTQLRTRTNDAKKVDREAGFLMEAFLRRLLKERGIDTIAGKYHVGNIEGESDVIIQSEKEIFLLELKKKNLTRKSREGFLYQILLDFAGAIFNPQVQAFKTESMLVKAGRLTFEDNGKTALLELKDRRICRISVSLNDFGPIHQQYILENVLKAFCYFVFSVNEEEVKAMNLETPKVKIIMEGYKDLKKKQDQLETYLRILIDKVPNYQRHLFFNSGFLSLEQFYFIVSLSANPNKVIEKLDDLRFLSFGTGDIWHEMAIRLAAENGSTDSLYVV